MDHMMPGMDGIETTKHLRELGYTGTIVALTANALAGNDAMFIQKGFDDFISKPIDIRHLNKVLNEFIRDKHPQEAAKATRFKITSEAEEVILQEEHRQQSPFIVDDELLNFFVKDAKNAVNIISTVYENIESATTDDWQQFVINTHAMKSALANINEHDTSETAGILEKAGKEQDKVTLLDKTQTFIDELNTIISRIDATRVDDDDDTATDSNPELLKEKLKQIKEACEEYDDIAIEAALLELKLMKWSKETKQLFEKISEYVLHSNFEEAAEQIELYI
jgi:YesN/AraC family two-component response regulator